jgi:glycosyltransferase involved in cell wall biosynthesis
MGQRARDRVSSGFSWDDYGDRIIKAYEKIFHEKQNQIS